MITIKNKKALEQRLAALGEVDDETKAKVACALIGHSRIVSMCFGYQNCGRCGEQIGDTLGGAGIGTCVVIGHKCPECEKNMKEMTWKDKYMVPDPFA
jgi:hypothetical protein